MSATQVPVGAMARIDRLMMDGAERRRLMDLGFCPGAVIERLLEAPFGGTTAFRVCGTVVAVRDDQTDQIEVTLCEN